MAVKDAAHVQKAKQKDGRFKWRLICVFTQGLGLS